MVHPIRSCVTSKYRKTQYLDAICETFLAQKINVNKPDLIPVSSKVSLTAASPTNTKANIVLVWITCP